MGGLKMFMIVMVVMLSFGLNGNQVAAQVHHVVGGDRGWDLDTDLTSWLSGRNFSVGDKIWFVYSAAQGGIAEVRKEEFEGCSMRNPIKLYTDGLVGISLDMEGTRYFASTNLNNCQSGLKLPVEVRSTTIPKYSAVRSADDVVADGPTSPSSAAQFCVSVVISMIGIWLNYL